MKTKILIVIIIAFLGCATITKINKTSEVPSEPSELTYPKLVLQPSEPQRIVLDNGLVVYLLEDHELPVLKVKITTRTGSIYDPADKVGLAELCGAVMRIGGTEKIDGDALDEKLEFMAASVETSIGLESGNSSLDVMSKDWEEGLFLLFDVLRNPAFAENKIELHKNKMKDEVLRQNDNPTKIATREFYFKVFGKDSPWARKPTVESIDNISRDDLIEFHKKYYVPNNSIMSVAGDFDKDGFIAKLKELTNDWNSKDVSLPEVEPIPEPEGPVVYSISREVTQSNIRLGHLGLRRHDPDKYAIEILSFILGEGGFTSRLMSEVRSNRGLAYAVGSIITEGADRGKFTAYSITKSESSIAAIELMRDIISDMCVNPPTKEEMHRAKETLSNQFVFRYDSSSKIVNQKAAMEYFNYPHDYLETYLEKLNTVTAEDVLAAAKKHLHPEKLVILVLGKPGDLDKPLETLGKVVNVDIE